jgi:hypothetical protein
MGLLEAKAGTFMNSPPAPINMAPIRQSLSGVTSVP